MIKDTGNKSRGAILAANDIVENTVKVMRGLMEAGVAVSIENPKGSLLLACNSKVY